MKNLDIKKICIREKTMLTALLLSAPAPIATGIAALISCSATQIADFLRRTAELVSMFVSWFIYRKLKKSNPSDYAYRARMERITNLTVAIAMKCSGIAMLVVGVARLFIYKVSGNAIWGLIIAALGFFTNTWFWWRYRSMTKERFDTVISGQHKLYQAKSSVDLCVVIVLTIVVIAPNHPSTKYIDALGCFMVALYLLYNGLDILREKRDNENSVV